MNRRNSWAFRLLAGSQALLLLALLPTNSPQAGELPTWKAAIDAAAELERVDQGLPSLQLAIGYKGAVVLDEAYGLADIEHGAPATPSTLYRTASISKWLTGTAALRLHERGLLQLDASIQEYCPEFPKKQWDVTTRNLLSHTSGIRHYANYDAMLKAAETAEARRELELWIGKNRLSSYTRYTDVIAPLSVFKDDPLMYEPGTRHMYSSFGYRVLACVLQGAAGKPYRELMREEVFQPAGMVAIVEDDFHAITPGRAAGYSFAAPGVLRRADFRDVSENLPAGGHLATARDLVVFAQAFDAGKLVNETSIALMSSLPTAKDGTRIESGYGHGVDIIGGFEGSIGHPGSQAGTSTLLILFPDRDLSIAVLTNVDGWRGAKNLVQAILEIVDAENPFPS